jgi:uncharacterized membrane protein YphA (DoxX/SURF4 family)
VSDPPCHARCLCSDSLIATVTMAHGSSAGERRRTRVVVVGLLTRLAAIPLLIDISGAIALTKIPELRPGGFLGVQGSWGMAHDARPDFSMLLGLIFLLITGLGRWSLDAPLARARRSTAYVGRRSGKTFTTR